MCGKASWKGTTVLQQTCIHACTHRTLHTCTKAPPLGARAFSSYWRMPKWNISVSHISALFLLCGLFSCAKHQSSLSNSVMSVFVLVWLFCWHLQSEKDFGNESTRQNWFNISVLLLIHSLRGKVLTTLKGDNVLHLKSKTYSITFLFGVYWMLFT